MRLKCLRSSEEREKEREERETLSYVRCNRPATERVLLTWMRRSELQCGSVMWSLPCLTLFFHWICLFVIQWGLLTNDVMLGGVCEYDVKYASQRMLKDVTKCWDEDVDVVGCEQTLGCGYGKIPNWRGCDKDWMWM